MAVAPRLQKVLGDPQRIEFAGDVYAASGCCPP